MGTIFSSRINSKGALATLFSGLAIAAIRLTLEVFKDSLDVNSISYAIADMNFLKFSSFFFLYCVAVTVLVSMVTERPSLDRLGGITFSTLSEEQKASNRASYNWLDIIASIFIIAIVIFVMIYFS